MLDKKLENQKRKCWIRHWVEQQNELEDHILKELQLVNAQQFHNFKRLSVVQVEMLVKLVGSVIF